MTIWLGSLHFWNNNLGPLKSSIRIPDPSPLDPWDLAGFALQSPDKFQKKNCPSFCQSTKTSVCLFVRTSDFGLRRASCTSHRILCFDLFPCQCAQKSPTDPTGLTLYCKKNGKRVLVPSPLSLQLFLCLKCNPLVVSWPQIALARPFLTSISRSLFRMM